MVGVEFVSGDTVRVDARDGQIAFEKVAGAPVQPGKLGRPHYSRRAGGDHRVLRTKLEVRAVAIPRRVAAVIGLVLHIPMLLIFYVQGLVMPTEGVLFLIAMWVALTVGIVILWRRAPLLILLVPLIDVALVYGVTAIGRTLFGWHL